MKVSPVAYAVALSVLVVNGVAMAADTSVPSASAEDNVEKVTVNGLRERLYQAGMLKDVVQKTELISEVAIEQRQAASLTDAIAISPGVRVNNECSMCGVKRVMLNGLRGEHTTVLVDGLPAYTMMAGFYGLDAASAAGIENIEIARGAGASLIAPEAIGGTINLVTKKARTNGVTIDLSGGENGYKKGSVVGTGVFNQGATRVTLTGQYDNRDQYDGDNNGVSESPDLENQSLTLFVSQDIGNRDNLHFRLNTTQSEIFGGPMGTNISEVKADYLADPDYESESLFVDDDVRNQYIGKGWETTEWIKSERKEAYLTWLHEFTGDLNMSLSVSHNQHTQDSFYEGFIYKADDDMDYLDARFNYAANASHMLTFGADARFESLKSHTNSTSDAYVSDSFDYDTQGVYVQDSWFVSDDFELSMALRLDSIVADFTDPSKPGNEIDETMLSPRLDMKYSHNEQWTSRFSVGKGYRAPLSFFESDHGLLDSDAGFQIDITELEKSLSVNYSLSYISEQLTATASLARTEVDNLANLSESDDGVPLLSQMSDTASVLVADVALGYQLTEALNLSVTAENIDYDRNFKQGYGVAPIEQRMTLVADWEAKGWDLYASATWIGSRDLTSFGTPDAPTFDAAGLYAKNTDAPAYWTVNMKVSKAITDDLNLYAGVNNLFDLTQVNDMQTPLFYEDGGFDVAHIYGPLRGREAYIGIKYAL